MKNVFCSNIINEKQLVSQGIQTVPFYKDIKSQLVLYIALVIIIAYLDFYMNCCYHGGKNIWYSKQPRLQTSEQLYQLSKYNSCTSVDVSIPSDWSKNINIVQR